MYRFKRCLAIINTRSGMREARVVFASALQQFLDTAGVTHTDVVVPGHDILQFMDDRLECDAIVVCGGDGTLSSVVNVMAVRRMTDALRIPIVLVPAGLQNSVANSLGVHSAERSVSSFLAGRVVSVPLWRVCIDGTTVRYVVSYVAVGSYAACVSALHTLHTAGEDYAALPRVRRKFLASAVYASMRHRAAPCRATLLLATPGGSAPRTVELPAPVRLVVASQMPLQHSHYSLTPQASYDAGTLSVTTATASTSRLRMCHLLCREARQGALMLEDGVGEQLAVHRMQLHFGAGEQMTAPELVMLDGEAVHVPPGSVLDVEKTDMSVLLVAG